MIARRKDGGLLALVLIASLCAFGVGEVRAWLATLPADHFAAGVSRGVEMFFGLTDRCR